MLHAVAANLNKDGHLHLVLQYNLHTYEAEVHASCGCSKLDKDGQLHLILQKNAHRGCRNYESVASVVFVAVAT